MPSYRRWDLHPHGILTTFEYMEFGENVPLLPKHHRIRPFVDSSALAGSPAEIRTAAEEQGYLYLPGFLPESLLTPVREFVNAAFAENGWVLPASDGAASMYAVPDASLSGRGWDDPNWVRFQDEFSNHPDFLAMADAPEVLQTVEAILGEPAWRASVNFCWLKLPGTPEQTTRPHQDEWYLPRSASMWTMWVPLVDTPFDVGPLGVVHGSHKGPVADHANAFTGMQPGPEIHWDSGEVKAGDVVFFSARTIHCAWSNVSPSLARVSADIRYEPQSVGGNSRLRARQK